MLISIITINYNNAEGLKKTIDSVRAQTFSDYEHIIVDGGSTDGSVGVIETALQDADYAKHVSWWCSEKDGGIYNAMNKGIAHASGDFINMMNSGDCFAKDVLAPLALIANENPDKILYGAVNIFENGKFIMAFGRSAEGLPQNMIAHQSCFVPASIYKKYGSYDESFKIASDYEKFLCFYKNNETFLYTNLIIADYDNTGVSSSNVDLVLAEDEKARKKYGYYVAPTRKQIVKKKIKRVFSPLKKVIKLLSL